MAIQQTRSAFMLTTIVLLSLSKLCVILTAAEASTINSGTPISEPIGNDHVSSSILKFGDRISPRNRPFLDPDKTRTASTATISELSGNTIVVHNSSINNSNNINNNNNNNNSAKRNLTALPYRDDGIDDFDDILEDDYDVADTRHLINNSAFKKIRNGINDDISNIVERSKHIADMNAQPHYGVDDENATGPLDIPFISSDDHSIGNVSSAQAHRLEMSTEFFVVPPPTSSSSSTKSPNFRAGGIILPNSPSMAKTKKFNPFDDANASLTSSSSTGNGTQPTIISTNNPLGLRKEPWVVPVLVLSSLAMIVMAAFEVFVLCKAWQTSPSRRHLFLGQMLLLGLFCCSGLAAILTTTPTVLSCGILRFGTGVAYALVFASLLVKCVFLISLNSGVYLPAPYQGLLLLFAVLIQVAVGTQWLLYSPADVENVPVPIRRNHMGLTRYPLLLTAQDITVTISLCKTPFHELLFSLIYCVFLILFVAVLAIKSRRIRENYREATYIGLAIGGSIPIWLGWTLCGLAVTERHKDACIAFGLVATSATVFLVMFMPKGRQLAAMGKEGLYMEDRDEQFNSLSRAGSGYSPSFFHFKPIKYGVMGNTLVSNNNTTNRNPTKNSTVASLGNGLFIRPTDETNVYTTLEPTLSSNPNVYFQHGGGVHPGMMY